MMVLKPGEVKAILAQLAAMQAEILSMQAAIEAMNTRHASQLEDIKSVLERLL